MSDTETIVVQPETEAKIEAQEPEAAPSRKGKGRKHGDKDKKPRKRRRLPGQSLCTFDGCDKETIARGLCHTHYRQLSRGKILTKIRKKVGCGKPISVRLEPDVKKALAQRVMDGEAESMYDALRQAVTDGVAWWEFEKTHEGTER